MRYVHTISRDTEIVLCRQETLDYGLDSVFFYIKHYLQFTYEYDSKVRTVDLPKLVFFKKNKRFFFKLLENK